MNAALGLLLVGLALGVSKCLIFCLPILLPYVAGTKIGFHQGLKTTLVFSLSRLSGCILLGALAGFSSDLLTGLLYGSPLGPLIFLSAGLLISFLGVLIVLGKEAQPHFCQILRKHAIDKGSKSIVLLGLLVGIYPCPPLLGILTYITFTTRSALEGAFYALCFGVGTAIITPLIILGVLASIIPHILLGNMKMLGLFQRACGLFLFVLGVQLIVSQVLH